MRILRRADYRRMPWKNGQGITEEVASFPHGGSMEDFHWRISIAHVGADGPFSVFPGIDRTIALLEGEGLVLDLPGGGTRTLRPGGDPFAFPGEWAVSSRNCAGATIDLNVMTRRGRCAHEMRRLTLAPRETFTAPRSGWIVFNAQATIGADAREVLIDRFDALSLDRSERLDVLSHERCEVLHISIVPA